MSKATTVDEQRHANVLDAVFTKARVESSRSKNQLMGIASLSSWSGNTRQTIYEYRHQGLPKRVTKLMYMLHCEKLEQARFLLDASAKCFDKIPMSKIKRQQHPRARKTTTLMRAWYAKELPDFTEETVLLWLQNQANAK